jgi:hypothetical protein
MKVAGLLAAEGFEGGKRICDCDIAAISVGSTSGPVGLNAGDGVDTISGDFPFDLLALNALNSGMTMVAVS